jgi:CBS domain-containing protein
VFLARAGTVAGALELSCTTCVSRSGVRTNAQPGGGCGSGRPVATFMTRSPKTISADALGVDALRLFEAHKIDDLIVIDAQGRPVGLVDGQDLPKLKIV